MERIACTVCFLCIKLTPHRRAGDSLRRAGVPAVRDGGAQQRQQIFVQCGGFLVTVAPFDAVVSVAAVILALGEQIQIVKLLRRVLHAHDQLRLGSAVGKRADAQKQRRKKRAEQKSRDLSFHGVSPFSHRFF